MECAATPFRQVTAKPFTELADSRFAFVAVPNAAGGSGIVNVLETGAAGVPQIDTNPYVEGVQGVLAPNVSVVADYWRQ